MLNQARREAQAHLDRLKAFYVHLVIYALLNIILIIINLLINPRDIWFYWVLLFWGAIIIIHGIYSFMPNSLFSRRWEEDKIQTYIRQHQKSPNEEED